MALLLAWGGLAAAAPARADEEPFAVRTLHAGGRPIGVLDVPPGRGGRGRDLVVACVVGSPPEERRFLEVFHAADLRAGGSTPALRLVAPAGAVAFDVADVEPGPAPAAVFLSAGALEVVPLGGPGPRTPRRVLLSPPAPLPPRTRELSRMPLVADWEGTGHLEAAVPAAGGVRLVRLDTGAERFLDFPPRAEYYTPDPGPPAYDGILELWLQWPRLTRGDDDGDGRPDLFALGRYGVAVFRGEEDGLARRPRRMALHPFPPEEELRFETTQVRLFARDLDGDGRTDLVVHRTSGTLQGSHASTEVHRNPGGGVDLARPPEASLDVGGGISDLDLIDLDGDGRVEIVQRVLRFGVVQLLRVLATGRAEVELAAYALRGPGIRGLERTWSRNVSLRLDFAEGRVEGLLPDVEGDWNGDGRRDLLYGSGRKEISLHLGVARPEGPGFGDRVARQAVPEASLLRVVDVDGDGLDDLVIWDERDASGALHWLRNRGVLPGTPPALRASP